MKVEKNITSRAVPADALKGLALRRLRAAERSAQAGGLTKPKAVRLEKDAIERLRHMLVVGLSAYGELERLRDLAELLKDKLPHDGLMPLHVTADACTVSKFAEALHYVNALDVTALEEHDVELPRHMLIVGLSAYGELERLRDLAEVLKDKLPHDDLMPLDVTGDACTVSKFAEALHYVHILDAKAQ